MSQAEIGMVDTVLERSMEIQANKKRGEKCKNLQVKIFTTSDGQKDK